MTMPRGYGSGATFLFTSCRSLIQFEYLMIPDIRLLKPPQHDMARPFYPCGRAIYFQASNLSIYNLLISE